MHPARYYVLSLIFALTTLVRDSFDDHLAKEYGLTIRPPRFPNLIPYDFHELEYACPTVERDSCAACVLITMGYRLLVQFQYSVSLSCSHCSTIFRSRQYLSEP